MTSAGTDDARSRPPRLALVTGAGGFIGSHLVEHLRESGLAVRAADVPGADLSAARGLGCETASVSLDDPASLAAACAGADLVFHVAAIFDFRTPWPRLEQVNVAGAAAMAEAAANAGAQRLVFFSSVGVYGLPAVRGIGEDGPKTPRNGYERSKWLGEQAVMEVGRRRGLEVVAIRPTLVYGPRSRFGHAVMLALLSMRASSRRAGPVPFVDGGPLVHSVHVRDVARAARWVSERGEPGHAYNVADRTPMPLGDFGEALVTASGLPFERRWKHRPVVAKTLLTGARLALPVLGERWEGKLRRLWQRRVERHGLVPAIQVGLDREWIGYLSGDHCYDTAKLAALGFTWEAPDPRTGLRDTVRWYRDARWLPRPRDGSGGAADS
ncbi:MAG: NAD(P)-dependent oxidoreductase [Deltaproteobacteria bacterium]|nr:NAD(P)-dependent oxidoreductase [Deltaproteobacteria bacterium]